MDNQNPTIPNPEQGDIFDQVAQQNRGVEQSQHQQPNTSPPSQQQGAGDVFDQLANGSNGQSTTANPANSASTPGGQSGFLSRLYETSGAKELVDLGKQVVNRPIDLYHQAVEATQQGDWKTASEKAALIVSGDIVDRQNPVYKAAEAIIVNPINEVKAAYRQDKKAGGSLPSLANSYRTLKGRIHQDAASGNYAGVAGDVAGTLDSHAMGAIPLLGPAIRQQGGNLDTDLHDANYAAIAGDVLGPLLTFGARKALSSIGDTAEAVNAARPMTEEIAGESVPVASSNPQLPRQSVASRVASAAASPEGAKAFVEEHVQPAAVKATQANFTKSALGAVDQLRSVRGEAPLSAKPPALQSVDDIARLLQSEAGKTYAALDEAAQPELDAWNEKYGDADSKPVLYGADDKPLQTPEIPPRPKLFTELGVCRS